MGNKSREERFRVIDWSEVSGQSLSFFRIVGMKSRLAESEETLGIGKSLLSRCRAG
jgi:hypothetical protein